LPLFPGLTPRAGQISPLQGEPRHRPRRVPSEDQYVCKRMGVSPGEEHPNLPRALSGRQKIVLEVTSAAPDGAPEDCGRSHPGLTPLGYESAALRARDEAIVPQFHVLRVARTVARPSGVPGPTGTVWRTRWRRSGSGWRWRSGKNRRALAALPCLRETWTPYSASSGGSLSCPALRRSASAPLAPPTSTRDTLKVTADGCRVSAERLMPECLRREIFR
jgi:hypothetical protein